MTKLRNNPMDESADPTPRQDPAKSKDVKKKKSFDRKDKTNALGKSDPDAFDAKNNNMHKKR